MSISTQVQAAYDIIAPVYASRNSGAFPESLLPLAQKFVTHIGAGELVEVGCGVGRDMAWFEAQGVRVTGFDLSSAMLAYARQVARGYLLMADMRNIAFCDAHFDGAWCCASLLHLPKQEAPLALREIYRILKPGGMLGLSVQQGTFEGWEEGGYVAGVKRFFARYTADEMTSLLAECGFITQEHHSAQAGARQWLSFLCVRQ